MSYGQLGDNAIPNRFRVEYCATGRGACKACGSLMAEMTPKIGVKERSHFHDGFDIKWFKPKCFFRSYSLNSVHDLQGYQKLKWEDQVAIFGLFTGAPPDLSAAGVQQAREHSELLWKVQAAIGGVPKPKIKEALELNERLVGDKDSPLVLKHTLADGLAFGRLPKCTWCDCEALVQEGGVIKCSGFMDGATPCAFKQTVFGVFGSTPSADATPIVRTAWTPHPIIKKALDKAGGLPTNAPALALGVASLYGAGGAAGGSAAAPMDVVDDGAESADEDGVAPEHVMAGMSFAVVGAVKPSAKELQQLIESHGGTFVAGSIGDGSCVTHLVSTEAESRKPTSKQAAKYAAAVQAGLPVVSADFVLALASELPDKPRKAAPPDDDDDFADASSSGGRGKSAKRPKRDEALLTEDLGTLKVPELKERLRERGLEETGKKAVLLERLQTAVDEEQAAAAAATTKGAGSAADPLTLDEESDEVVEVDDDDDVKEVAPPPPAAPPPPPPEEESKPKGKKRALPTSFAGGAAKAAEERAAAAAAVEAVHGAKLRQRKHMRAYLLDGDAGPKLPSVAALQPDLAAAAALKAAATPAEREMRPPITPGSALLRVDPGCSKGNVKVYVDQYNVAYNAVCNSFDIQTGVNKFWKMQLLCTGAARPKYYVFRAWGRVGGDEESRGSGRGPQTGGDTIHEFGEGAAGLEKALKQFTQQFKQKCAVEFLDCKPPCQHPGGYNVTLLAGQGAADAAETARQAAASSVAASRPVSVMPSTLCPEVEEFVALIHSEKMMQQQLKEANIDLEKMPLGSISDRQVSAGYEVLREIGERLTNPLPNAGQQQQKLMSLSNKFYNTIPHTFARQDTPPIISTVDQLRAKSDMVESLLSVAQGLSAKLGEMDAQEHPTDAAFRRLKCGLDLATEEEAEMVKEYTRLTHASTHNSYRLKVKHVFRAARDGEAAAFEKHRATSNRQLLWHGSRLTNWVGILSQGLRIAPPEAPVTGYMFGKGLYFADMVSKSANYCMGTSANPTAVMTLCDVALGSPYERITADPEAAEHTKAHGNDSCFGIGRTCPDPAGTRTLASGATVPMGKGGPNQYLEDNVERLKQAEGTRAPALQYNEYIVYDTAQVEMKYVVVMEMDFSIELDD